MSPRTGRKILATEAPINDAEDLKVNTPGITGNKRKIASVGDKQPLYEDIGITQLIVSPDAALEPSLPSKHRGFTVEMLQAACDHLKSVDPLLIELIDLHGPPDRLLAKDSNTFASLSKSICFQQLATRAASVIYGRVLQACGCEEDGVLNPDAVMKASAESLMAAGLSGRKVEYIKDLSRHYQQGLLSDEAIDAMNFSELHTALTRVKGLGPWSVDMFALFHLGLPDILPTGDLGVKKGMQALYALKNVPTPTQMETLTEHWKPYRSVGSYFMWRVEVTKKKKV